jgi:hypothetical protein
MAQFALLTPELVSQDWFDYFIPWCLCGEADVCRCAEKIHFEAHGRVDETKEMHKLTRSHARFLCAHMDVLTSTRSWVMR